MNTQVLKMDEFKQNSKEPRNLYHMFSKADNLVMPTDRRTNFELTIS